MNITQIFPFDIRVTKMSQQENTILFCRTAECCPDCYSIGGFKKFLHLPLSLLDIYMHGEQQSVEPIRRLVQKQNPPSTRDILILHNSNPAELNRSMVINDPNKFKAKCLSCKAIVRRVQDLLEEIKTIRRSETYSICDHCRFTSGAKCKRCEYVLLNFKSDQRELENQRRAVKQWLRKVKELLQTILSGKVCKYGMYQNTDNIVELEKLLGELYPKKERRQPEIDAFPSSTTADDDELAQSKAIMGEVLQKMRMYGTRRYPSDDSLYVSPSDGGDCICKVFKNRELSIKTSKEHLLKQHATSTPRPTQALDKVQPEEIIIKVIKYDKPKVGGKITNKQELGKKPKVKKDVKATNVKMAKEKELKGREKIYQAVKEVKSPIVAKTVKSKVAADKDAKAIIAVKTVYYQKQTQFEETSLEVCGDRTMRAPREMIRGMEIVPYDKDYMGKGDEIADALYFRSKFDFETNAPSVTKSTESSRETKILKDEIVDRSGVICYQLSDKKFIDNGWTQLPAVKTLRRMDIYKMIPVKPYNWFSQNKSKEVMFYKTGKKMAEILENGSGFWFYDNGLNALKYYDIRNDTISKKMVTVFSHEVDMSKQPNSQKVLACFDYNGNGVVYDNKGNQRLKYNQSEGFLFDASVGAPGLWKWHSLNDPPVYSVACVDTYPESPCPELEELMQQDRIHNQPKDADEAMLATELSNFAKEAARKLEKAKSTKYKAFEIKMKAMKINDFFSLKVIDQANVILLFKANALTMKLNMGMILQNDEIIDSEYHDTGVVVTSFDKMSTEALLA